VGLEAVSVREETLLYQGRGVSIHVEEYPVSAKDWYELSTVLDAGMQDTKRFVHFIDHNEPEEILEVVKDAKAGLTAEEQQQVVKKFNEFRLEQMLTSGGNHEDTKEFRE
jgi:hypothetical protein